MYIITVNEKGHESEGELEDIYGKVWGGGGRDKCWN